MKRRGWLKTSTASGPVGAAPALPVTRIAIATSKGISTASDRALAMALTEQGCEVHAVVWSEPRPSWREFDAVVVRSCWDYHLRVEEFLAWIGRLERDRVAVLNPPDLIRWNIDKTYLAGLDGAGISQPETIFVEPGVELDLALACDCRGWGSAVVKPTISGGAWRTERRRSGPVRGPAMVQRYLEAIETEGEWSLVYFNQRFSHSLHKKPAAGDFRVQAAFGGTKRAAPASGKLRRFAEAVLQRLAWPATIARVDLVADEASILLMELEVIEPELDLGLCPGSAQRLATAIRERLARIPGCEAMTASAPAADCHAIPRPAGSAA